jgi:hypothetical protein
LDKGNWSSKNNQLRSGRSVTNKKKQKESISGCKCLNHGRRSEQSERKYIKE